jgi:hypothetical protein
MIQNYTIAVRLKMPCNVWLYYTCSLFLYYLSSPYLSNSPYISEFTDIKICGYSYLILLFAFGLQSLLTCIFLISFIQRCKKFTVFSKGGLRNYQQKIISVWTIFKFFILGHQVNTDLLPH